MPASGKVTRLTKAGHVAALSVTPKRVVTALDSLVAPDDFYLCRGKGAPRRLTSVNAAKLAGVDMPTVTRFSFKGANNDTVYGYAVKPAGSTGKVPIAFMVHGGPQGSSNNSWSYRWNPAVFAGAGYGLVAVDFHGSTGYGQAFTDAIRNNWGGWPLEDLKAGLKAATDKFAWLDGDRACALGASYGGYMMNWIEGQWPDRFKCIVQHDGVFDARAMAYETEELWFDEWEHGGKAYYEDPAAFEKWNPVNFVEQVEDADAGDHRREGLPHPLHPGARRLHRAPAARHPVAAAGQSGREPLGAQAEELAAMVSRGDRLDGSLDGEIASGRLRRPESSAKTAIRRTFRRSSGRALAVR